MYRYVTTTIETFSVNIFVISVTSNYTHLIYIFSTREIIWTQQNDFGNIVILHEDNSAEM